MLQFYFLSILMNAIAGYLLFFGSDSDLREFKCGYSVTEDKFRLVVGILSALTGFFKILSPVQGDVPVIGDFIPAVAGLLCGFILFIQYYRSRSSTNDSESGEKVNKFLTSNRKLIAAAAMVAAVLHFIFPGVLLL